MTGRRDDGPGQGPGDSAAKRRKKRLFGIGKAAAIDGAGAATGNPFFGTIFEAATVGGRALRDFWRSLPSTCDSREELYEVGSRLLRKARSKVLSVSVLTTEDPIVADHPAMREYFVLMHSLSYGSSLVRHQVKHHRFIDMTDPEKCDEAHSLLCFGRDITITDTKHSVEFLRVDDGHLLIGFPTDDGRGRLATGIYLTKKEIAEAMEKWVSDGRGKPISKQAGLPVNPAHADSCMCRVRALLKADQPIKECAAAFDAIAGGWARFLYDPVQLQASYAALTNLLTTALGKRDSSRFLDVGCGLAYGAPVLAKAQFEYVGIDCSSGMIEGARKSLAGVNSPEPWSLIHGDALAGLMPGAPLTGPHRVLKSKFDVIACQGNTFDFFLGRAQKLLALYLFASKLRPGGVLVISGHRFDIRTRDRETRHCKDFNVPITYDLQQKNGEYARLKIVLNEGKPEQVEIPSLLIHPTDPAWLTGSLKRMGFRRLTETQGVQWLRPSGCDVADDLAMYVRDPK